jgi:hypothetical protein
LPIQIIAIGDEWKCEILKWFIGSV